MESSGFTKQRQAVLQVVRDSEKHLTPIEVFEDCKRILPGISFATVYNSLRYLKEEGFIGEIKFCTGASRYDRNIDRHDHAICDQCGKLVDLDLPEPTSLLNQAADLSRFKPASIEFILHGICPECSR